MLKNYTLRAKEIADSLSVTRQTILKLFRNGEMKGIRIGGIVRFSEEDVQAYLDKQSNNCRQEKRA